MRGSLLEALKQCGIVNSDLSLYVRVERRLRNNPDLIMLINTATKFLRYGAPMKVRLQCVIKNITHQPLCKTCGSVLRMRTTGPHRYTFAEFCGPRCFAKSVQEKRAATNLKRYGSANVMSSLETQQKRRETWLRRYGVENVLQSREIQDRIRHTKASNG
jgi:hypothetical protein